VKGDILMVMQHITNGKTDLFGRQFFRRHLVEQRLEGVIVVLIDERDPDVGIAQFFQRADSAETGAKDDYMGDVSHSFSTLSKIMLRRRAIPPLTGVREMSSCVLAVVSSPAVITAFLANRRITASRATASSNHPRRRIAIGDYGPRNQR
jgi:hypothetical protein